MSTPTRQQTRPAATITRRPPLAPIPPAVFREPLYVDGQPYEDTASRPGADDEQDDAA